MTVRVTSELIVASLMRMADLHNAPVYLRHRGDATAGAIYVSQVFSADKAQLFALTTGIDGKRYWMEIFDESFVEETEVESKISSLIQFDTDMWIIEFSNETPDFDFKKINLQ